MARMVRGVASLAEMDVVKDIEEGKSRQRAGDGASSTSISSALTNVLSGTGTTVSCIDTVHNVRSNRCCNDT